jgi:hypothetical protein
VTPGGVGDDAPSIGKRLCLGGAGGERCPI